MLIERWYQYDTVFDIHALKLSAMKRTFQRIQKFVLTEKLMNWSTMMILMLLTLKRSNLMILVLRMIVVLMLSRIKTMLSLDHIRNSLEEMRSMSWLKN